MTQNVSAAIAVIGLARLKVSQHLNSLKVGDKAEIAGPSGELTYKVGS
jgi:ferredoxin-NADP reductase